MKKKVIFTVVALALVLFVSFSVPTSDVAKPSDPKDYPHPEKKPPNVVFPVRVEEDAYINHDDIGFVTPEESDYLFVLSNSNHEAYLEIVENRYPGTIMDAYADKYGLPADVDSSEWGKWWRGIKDGTIVPPEAYPGASDTVNYGTVDPSDIP